MNKASIFMNASWVGLIGLAIGGLSLIPAVSSALAFPGMILAVLSGFAMLATRNADEYTLALWTAGASVAFATMLIIFIGLPAAEGIYDGATGAERRQDIPASIVPILTILAFYAGLFAKRLLGDA
ncbi:hypothetical protein [Erythrobacter sp. THAF29]|uniref:hypothetical protein n=1 Tax=Erythrobacter sp. THAF29 TaxID=2587851 RepID=UPI0012686068|nr:hypothetical protein [Erythrobacter sp. THAF29]QFT77845.1 hypothetical protein FIU90_09890 [Erythrobacter sp. THAF29]